MVEEYVEGTILLSIWPRYASALMNGSKVAEFRRKIARTEVRRVLVYSTAPESAVVGYFNVDRIETASPRSLWKSFGHAAGIDKNSFLAYFAGINNGHALVAGSVVKFDRPIPLTAINQAWTAPQGFMYVDKSAWSRLACISTNAERHKKAA